MQQPEEVREKINYRDLFEISANALLVVTLDGEIVDANNMACTLLGYTLTELISKNVAMVLDTGPEVNVPLFIRKKLKNPTESFIFKSVKQGISRIPLEVTIQPLQGGGKAYAVISGQALSSRRHMEEVITRRNEYLSLLHETSLALMNRLDLNELLPVIVSRAGQLVGTEHSLLVMYNEESKRLEQKLAAGFYSQFSWDYIKINRSAVGKAFAARSPVVVNDYQSWPRRADWHERFAKIRSIIAVPLKIGRRAVGAIAMAHVGEYKKFGDNELMILTRFAEIASIALDNARLYSLAQREIIERVKAEEKLRYCSFHDVVTGLYNRAYFEERMAQLEKEGHIPFGIVVCDVDGLKFVNDSFGHMRGDGLLAAAAETIRHSFREEDTVARIGGDEFAILLPDSTPATVQAACLRIRESVERYNQGKPELPLSISVGYAVAEDACITAGELFKKADNNMYQEKIRRSRRSRSDMKQALVKALEKRDFINTGHAERMERMIISMAMLLKLPTRTLEELCLLAQFHDIGKVGIVDNVLFKTDRLNQEEMAEMRRHSEIGHRIAQSIPELMPIGDYILKHHEWWNGQGYPLGLVGKEIPLESRILSIVDAYDAMTNDRPYRQKISSFQALEEISSKASSQFDPELVKCFVETMQTDRREKSCR